MEHIGQMLGWRRLDRCPPGRRVNHHDVGAHGCTICDSRGRVRGVRMKARIILAIMINQNEGEQVDDQKCGVLYGEKAVEGRAD